MEVLARARAVADQICRTRLLSCHAAVPGTYAHVGATLADAVLQAGLNYRSVVLPRVRRIRLQYPCSTTLPGLMQDLAAVGPRTFLGWRHEAKPRILATLVALFARHGIETEADLAGWIASPGSRDHLLNVHGVGPKTADYLARLVGLPAVAVDRHLERFVAAVVPECGRYEEVRTVLSYAADLLGIDRSCLDHAIWCHMSTASVGGPGAQDARERTRSPDDCAADSLRWNYLSTGEDAHAQRRALPRVISELSCNGHARPKRRLRARAGVGATRASGASST